MKKILQLIALIFPVLALAQPVSFKNLPINAGGPNGTDTTADDNGSTLYKITYNQLEAWIASQFTTGGLTGLPLSALHTQSPGTIVCNSSLTATTNPSQCYAPFWYHAGNALTYSSFSAASTSNSITLFTLPAGGVIHAVKIQHSTAFTGASITGYTVSVGLSGNTAKYAAPFSVFSTPSGSNLLLSSGTLFEENDSATTAITVTATSTGANLNAVTAGVVDIWVLMSLGI